MAFIIVNIEKTLTLFTSEMLKKHSHHVAHCHMCIGHCSVVSLSVNQSHNVVFEYIRSEQT